MTVLVVALAFAGSMAVAIAIGLVTEDAKGWIPHLRRHLLNRACDRLPSTERDRWHAEWSAELEAASDRPLWSLAQAIRLNVAARTMARELTPPQPLGERVRSQGTAAVSATSKHLATLGGLLRGVRETAERLAGSELREVRAFARGVGGHYAEQMRQITALVGNVVRGGGTRRRDDGLYFYFRLLTTVLSLIATFALALNLGESLFR
jgi:hypothetical protein